MGLENLKSIFQNTAKFTQTNVETMDSDFNDISQKNATPEKGGTTLHEFSKKPLAEMVSEFSIQGATPQEVDYMGGDNSYYDSIVPSISGFNSGFNKGGYSFDAGQKGDSKFIDINTGTHTRPLQNLDGDIITFSDTYTFDNGMPIGVDETWTNVNTYYDSIHTTNAITDTFSGVWSYINLIPPDGTSWTIPTITPNSADGFTYQDGIHTDNAITDTFSGTWSFTNLIPPDGTTWTIPTDFTYQDGITYTTTPNSITDTFGDPVSFMGNDFATGFTISNNDDDKFTTQFVGISGDTYSPTIPIPTHTGFVRDNVIYQTITFEKQRTEGLDLMNSVLGEVITNDDGSESTPIENMYATGFTPNRKPATGTTLLGLTDFVGVSDDGLSFTGTDRWSVTDPGTTDTHTFSNIVDGWFTSNLPAGGDATWTIPTGFTYQDAVTYPTTPNSITDTFGGPVNFLDILDEFTTGFTLSDNADNKFTTKYKGITLSDSSNTYNPTGTAVSDRLTGWVRENTIYQSITFGDQKSAGLNLMNSSLDIITDPANPLVVNEKATGFTPDRKPATGTTLLGLTDFLGIDTTGATWTEKTSLYSITDPGTTDTHTFGNTTYTSGNPYPNNSTLAPPSASVSTEWIPMNPRQTSLAATYYDSFNYSILPNPTSGLGTTTFGAGYVVDFMTIGNKSTIPAHSHFTAGTGSLSGFDVNFKTGGASGANFGSSKYSTMIDGGNVLAGTLEGIYTDTDSTITFGTDVDFMDGKSLHTLSAAESSTYLISGFTQGFNSNLVEGSGNAIFGSSKYSGIMGAIVDLVTPTVYSGMLEDVYTTPGTLAGNKISYGDTLHFTDSKYDKHTLIDGFVGEPTGSNYLGISDVLTSTTWANPSTDYYDSLYTINDPITSNVTADTTTLGMPYTVDFMTGKNSYYSDIIIPGFTKGFNTGGYNEAASDFGSTNFSTSSGTHIEFKTPAFTLDAQIAGYDHFKQTDADWTYPLNVDTMKFPGGFTANMSDSRLAELVDDDGGKFSNTNRYTTLLNDPYIPNITSWPGPYSTTDYTSSFISSWGLNSGQLDIDGDTLPMLGESIDTGVPGDSYILNLPRSQYSMDFLSGHTNQLDFSNTSYITGSNINTTAQHIGRVPLTLQNQTTVYDSLEDVGQLGAGKLIFQTLYGGDQTVTDDKFLGNAPGQSKDYMALQSDKHNPSGQRGTEPYVTRTRLSDQYGLLGRIIDDEHRLFSYMKSTKGLVFIANQLILGSFQQYEGLYDPTGLFVNAFLPKRSVDIGGVFIPIPTIFTKRSTGPLVALAELLSPKIAEYNSTYSEWIKEYRDKKTGDDAKTYAQIERKRKPLGFQALEKLADLIPPFLGGTSDAAGGSQTPKEIDGVGPKQKLGKSTVHNSMNYQGVGQFGKGDLHTLLPIVKTETPSEMPTDHANATGTQNGMPFYFRDLRDNTILFFRAYIEGLNESVSPSWNSENYIGRSEPVYTYTNAEREVGFDLKLFAQTKDELNMIYHKMNRLTSMCYPEYSSLVTGMEAQEGGESTDTPLLNSFNKTRMKPPMLKLRLGELWGTKGGNEAVCFLKSLSYTFPDTSPWEIESGKRVPKSIDVSLTLQIIHNDVPSLDFAKFHDADGKFIQPKNTFYGINQDKSTNEKYHVESK